MGLAGTGEGLLVPAAEKMASRARRGGCWCPRQGKRPRGHGKGIAGARGGENGLAGTGEGLLVPALLHHFVGGLEGEDEGGYDVGDEAAAGAEYRDNPDKPDEGGINLKIIGNAAADTRDLAVCPGFV